MWKFENQFTLQNYLGEYNEIFMKVSGCMTVKMGNVLLLTIDIVDGESARLPLQGRLGSHVNSFLNFYGTKVCSETLESFMICHIQAAPFTALSLLPSFPLSYFILCRRVSTLGSAETKLPCQNIRKLFTELCRIVTKGSFVASSLSSIHRRLLQTTPTLWICCCETFYCESYKNFRLTRLYRTVHVPISANRFLFAKASAISAKLL